MHRAVLSNLIMNPLNKQFWVKPVGIPDEPVGDHLEAAHDNIRVDFSVNPSAIRIGDIVFVYVVGASLLLYVGQITSAPKEATPAEIAKESWRSHWTWGIDGRNLSPIFGAKWKQYKLAPFALAKEYNELYPDEAQSLGSINFGSDKLKISHGFASFILDHIIKL